MKRIVNNIFLLGLVLMITLTACFDDDDNEEYTIVGAVGTIALISPSNNTPVAGEQITVKLRYYSENIAAKEVRLFVTEGTGTKTLVGTKAITGFDTRNSYEDVFTYTVSAGLASGASLKFTGEIVTINDLVNSNTLTIKVK